MLTTTSGLYTYNTPQNRLLIDDAYERCGIVPQLLSDEQLRAASRTANLILQSYPNRGLNLWLRRTAMLALIPYQAQYNLPLYTLDVLEMTLRRSVRNLSGTAYSSAGGVAANAFDGNPATACTQNAPNGFISYQWPYTITQPVGNVVLNPYTNGTTAITLVGVISNVTRDYTLTFSWSPYVTNWDPNTATWYPVLSVPTQTYTAGQLYWFSVVAPAFGTAFRCQETNGATLDIQELYFNNQVNDVLMTRISESEYMSYPNKSLPTMTWPSSFYVDRQINPVLYVWPSPAPQYNNIFYSYTQQIQDFGQLMNAPQLPARFLSAFTAELAWRLSAKVAPDRSESLKADAKEEYAAAHNEDRERVPLRVFGDYMQGWAQE